MRIAGDWLNAPSVQAVLGMLTDAGYRAYVVGGAVRNALLGAPVADLDIATDARPDQVGALAAAAGLRVVPTGIDHGTVTVVADGIAHEVTTFRRDVETDGRRAVVAYSDRLEDDARRRDFTMNALYATAAGAVIDPIGGLPDLVARRVRFVGDPHDRIREDYLRILRFFRFHAVYGDPAGGIDPAGLAAAADLADGLGALSRERVGHEMRRLLGAADPAPALAAMQAAGVLARVLPGGDVRAIAPLVHLEAGLSPRWLRRLAALGGADPADALRLSRAEVLALAARRAGLAEGTGAGEIAYRHGVEVAEDVVLIRQASLCAPLPPDWHAPIIRGAAARFPVTAADLMPACTGAALGQALRDLENRWIASGFELSREQLLA